MTKSIFPHDRTYDYDADHVNGEIFNGDDDLSKVGRVALRAPNVGSNDSFAPAAKAPPEALECGGSTPLSLSPTTTPKKKRIIFQLAPPPQPGTLAFQRMIIRNRP